MKLALNWICINCYRWRGHSLSSNRFTMQYDVFSLGNYEVLMLLIENSILKEPIYILSVHKSKVIYVLEFARHN